MYRMSDKAFEAFQKTTIAYKAAGEGGYVAGARSTPDRACFVGRGYYCGATSGASGDGYVMEWGRVALDLVGRCISPINDELGFAGMCALADQIILNQHAIRADEYKPVAALAVA